MIVCAIGSTEIILIAVVILLIFGGKKIPELMKGVGQGVRQFKKGLNEDQSDTKEDPSREAVLHERLKEKERQLRELGIDPNPRGSDPVYIMSEHENRTHPKP